MSRDQIRKVLNELRLAGELWRGHMLIRLRWGEWDIPNSWCPVFRSRREARKWIDKRLGLATDSIRHDHEQVV